MLYILQRLELNAADSQSAVKRRKKAKIQNFAWNRMLWLLSMPQSLVAV